MTLAFGLSQLVRVLSITPCFHTRIATLIWMVLKQRDVTEGFLISRARRSFKCYSYQEHMVYIPVYMYSSYITKSTRTYTFWASRGDYENCRHSWFTFIMDCYLHVDCKMARFVFKKFNCPYLVNQLDFNLKKLILLYRPAIFLFFFFILIKILNLVNND